MKPSVLEAAAAGARRIDVVSAFFDVTFLSLVAASAAKLKPRPEVRIILHGSAGRKLDNQLQDLRAFEKKWRRALPDLQVGLVFGSALFHSKLFVFKSARGSTAFIGSANATAAAFLEDNEEILLELHPRDVDPQLLSYVDEVARESVPLSDVAPHEIHTIVQWYRDAVCYYKPTASFGLRFPLNVPERLATELTRSDLDEIDGIARDQTNITYSLTSALDPSEEGRGRTVVSAVGIQTCYGWWVPTAYANGDEGFQAKLDDVAAVRRHKVDAKCDAILRDYDRGLVLTRARSAFATLRKMANGRWPQEGDDVDERFGAFLKKAVEKLQDERWREKLAAVYAPASVPEIWADPDSVREFEDSFYEYIEYIGQRTGAKPYIWKLLSRVCEFGQEDPPEEIKRRVRSAVRRGWTRDLWGSGP